MFKIGDLVIGTNNNPYTLTNKHTVMTVTGFNTKGTKDLRVSIKDGPSCGVFNVESKYFTLYKQHTFKEL